MKRCFNRVWIFALAAGVLYSAASAPPAWAADESIFTVGNYPVEARAENAVAAKEKAIADGQQAAFRSLLKRIVPVTSYSAIDRLQSVKAANLIGGFSVRSERNSDTQYIANLDFSFQPDAVRSLLRQEAVPYVDAQAPVVVLVPAMMNAAASAGKWTEIWRSLDLKHTLTPARIDVLKPEIHPDTLSMLASGDQGATRILTTEYRADTIVVALAEYDASSKRLNVTMSGQDSIGPIAWKRSYRVQDGDLNYAMELAAVVGLGVLEGRWKSLKTEGHGGTDLYGSGSAVMYGGGGSGLGQQVTIDVQFSDDNDWDDIRRQILDTPGVDDVAVHSIFARNAEVSLTFPGGGAQLAQVLSAQGLRMRNTGQVWVLRSNN